MKTFTMRSALAASILLLSVSLPAVTAEASEYKGCFTDSTGLDDEGPYTYQSDGYCQEKCLKKNAAVFALWKGSNCLCGDELPEKSSKGDEDKCDNKCSGWPDKMCGGKEAYSVYLTGAKKNVDYHGSKSSTSSSSSSTDSSETGAQTVIETSDAEPTEDSDKDDGPNTAAIAAGVVVGVVGFFALIGAGFFLWRFRNRKNNQAQFDRGTGVDQYGQHMSQNSMSDSRFDGDFMAQRRQSNGSIDDDQDFSRRILQVTNGDADQTRYYGR
ncbi:hypothetical protein BDW42DRAFT_199794 [Aspergillus taichungensis]|uniref:WSC domain-containing protein n=1 Tax=Aspergillus taichungensis TaxID=482145 RepID=A0A2J5I2J7_9EURO|nr:hypothetical protein BDW42DRAFT_199794 [Aspergillus taichungensis]